MKAIKVVTGLVVIFIQMPIWWFLVYSILKAINPDRLVWFMFYAYVPIGLFTSILSVTVDKLTDK